MKNKTSYKELIDQTEYIKMMIANIVSRFGDSLDAIAYSWIAYEVTGNAAIIALVIGVNYLPTVILQPITGALVKHIEKKKVMVLCDLGRAITVALTGLLYFLNLLNPLILCALTLLNSSFEAIRMPAGMALTPQILTKEKMALGKALNASLERTCEIVGTAMAGGIISLIGSSGALYIDAATFAISALCIAFINNKEVIIKEPITIKSTIHEMKEGLDYIKNTKVLALIIGLGIFMNASFSPSNIFRTIYVAEYLKMDVYVLSVIGTLHSAGLALGSFFTPKLMDKFSNRNIFLFSGLIGAFIMVALATFPKLAISGLWQLAILTLFNFVLGFSQGFQIVVYSTSFMLHTDMNYIARIGSVTNALLVFIIPIVSFLCSFIVQFINVPDLFLMVALVSVLVYGVLFKVKLMEQI